MLSRLFLLISLFFPALTNAQQRIIFQEPVIREDLPSLTAPRQFVLSPLLPGQTYLLQVPGPERAYHLSDLRGGSVEKAGATFRVFRATSDQVTFTVSPLSSKSANGIPLRVSAANYGLLQSSNPHERSDFPGAVPLKPGPAPDKSATLIQVERNPNAQRLVDAIFKNESCFETSNHSYTGVYEFRDILGDTVSQLGVFSNGTASIGIDEGVVLTNGRVKDIDKPNTFYASGYLVDLNQQSDADLEAIQPGVDYFDIAVLEFDFTPTSNEISFDYVFASDEYCSGPTFTTDARDVFAFVISGPGITGNLPSGGRNIAVLPDGVTPVNTLTIDNTNNDNLFVANRPLSGVDVCGNTPPAALDFIEFDGYTVPLTARADVIPCETYHLKLIVADAGDQLFHSAVFFQRGSFAAGLIDVSEPGANAETQDAANSPIEGCSDGQLIFRRLDNDVSQPLTVYFNISPTSTATFGVDYTMPTDSFTIPAGQLSDTLIVDIFGDDLVEGTENIIIRITGTCNCEAFTSEFFIVDPPPIITTLDDPMAGCAGGSITLAPTASGGIGDYAFSWSTGGMDSLETIPLLAGDSTYYVSITDNCGQTAIDSATVSVADVRASVDGTYTICDGPSVTVPVILSGGTDFTVEIRENQVGGTSLSTYSGGPDTIWLTYFEDTSLELVSVSADGCDGVVSGTANVSRSVFNVSANLDMVDCRGASTGSITIDVNGRPMDFTYDWGDPGLSGSTVSGLAAGNYPVSITDAGGCSIDTSFTITQPEALMLSVDAVTADCAGVGATLTPRVTGGQPPYAYAWSDGVADSLNLISRPPGTQLYRLSVTDACNVTVVDSVSVESPDIRAGVSGAYSLCQTPSVSVPLVLSGGTSYTIVVEENGNTRTLTANGTDTLFLAYTSAVNLELVSVTADGCPGNVSGSAVVSDGSFSVTAQVGDIRCHGDDSGSITIDVNGSPQSFTYVWDHPNVSGFSPTNLTAGIYGVEIFDAAGCSFDTSFLLTQPATPLTIGLDSLRNQDCRADGFIGLSLEGGTPPYVVDWEDDASADLVRPDLDGGRDYFLVVTDANGCLLRDTFPVSDLRTTLNVSTSGDGDLLTCAQSSITYFALLNYPAPVDYRWLDGANQEVGTADTLLVTEPGIYSLIVTDPANGCLSQTSLTVERDEDVLILRPINEFNLTCDQSAVDLSVEPTGYNGPVNYEWFDESGQMLGTGPTLPAVDTPGSYVVRGVRPDNGCSDEISVNLGVDREAPAITILPGESLTCSRDTATLKSQITNAAALSYVWSTENGRIVGPTDQSELRVTSTGNYLLRVTNQDNGCFSEETVGVTEDLRTLTADAGTDRIFPCSNPGFSLTGSAQPQLAGTTYRWLNQSGIVLSTAAEFRPSGGGTYVLEATHPETGCPATDEVELRSEGPTRINLQLRQPPCADVGATVTVNSVIGGTPPYSVGLENRVESFDLNVPIDGIDEGFHVLEVTDANGCSTFDTLQVFPSVGFTGDAEEVATRIGENVTLGFTTNRGEGIASVVWESSQELSCLNCPNPSASPLESFTAVVNLVDTNGCTLRLIQQVVVDERTLVYAPNVFRPNGPPGDNEKFTLFADQELIPNVRYLRVFDRWGSLMWERIDFPPNDVNLGWDGQSGGKPLNSGAYIFAAEVDRFDGTTQMVYGTVTLLW